MPDGDPANHSLNLADDSLLFLKDTDKRQWDAENLPPPTLPPEMMGGSATSEEILNLVGIENGTRTAVGFFEALEQLGDGNLICGCRFIDTAQEMMDNDDEYNNLFASSVARHRNMIEQRYEGFLRWKNPNVSHDQFWLESMVLKRWEGFFFAM
ncbi:hypothetical protein FRC06_008115, partial [Ceratobasidium sp. 370]